MMMVLALGAAAMASEVSAQASATAPGPKIAYVNSQRLFQESPGAKEAETTIQREMDKYRAELALLEDSINNMMTDYQQRSVMLSPDAKKKAEDAIRLKRTNFENRSQSYESSVTKRQAELVQPIMDKINKVLSDIRKEQNIAIIFDAATRSIVQADTTLDLTAEVVKRLKAAAPSAAAPKKPGS